MKPEKTKCLPLAAFSPGRQPQALNKKRREASHFSPFRLIQLVRVRWSFPLLQRSAKLTTATVEACAWLLDQ